MQQCRVEKLERQASTAAIRRFVFAAVLAAVGALLWSAPPASAAPVVHPTLVKTIATSGYTPPSPDPSGIAYRPGRDRLLIADSEVDEMPLYQGFNLFTATRAGSGVGSGTRCPRQQGAHGPRIQPDRGGTLFISDDDRERVWVVRPGADGRHGTGDDIVSCFSTSVFGSTDAEGVVYDPATGHVFIGDGPASRSTGSIRSTACSATGTTSSPTSTSPGTASATARAWESTRAATGSSRSIRPPTRFMSSARAAAPCCGS